jgi:UDP-glucose 4-epimerase
MVTGGAGYIGAHVVRSLLAADMGAIVLDDFSSGRREFVPDGVPVVDGSIEDAAAVGAALREHRVTGVVHLAALKYAGVSMEQPLDFYRVNVEGTRRLLAALVDAGVENIVFSSSAAIFGTPDVDLVDEDTPVRPESPYGETKLIGEWLCRDVARVATLRHVSLRYFNVVGSGDTPVYDVSPHNLFPIVLAALTEGRTPVVRGTDYPTPDGSCVRDYIHVADVADAHVAAARKLAAGAALRAAYNLGRGEGVSVIEIMEAIRRGTGIEFEYERGDRRPGDPARIVTSSARAEADLEWRAERDLDEMVRSAWSAWHGAEGARLG